MIAMGKLVYTQTVSMFVLVVSLLWLLAETKYHLQELDNLIHNIMKKEEHISQFWQKSVLTVRVFSIGTILSYLILVGYYQ